MIKEELVNSGSGVEYSWVDALIDRLERARTPAWLILLLIAGPTYLAFSAIQWAGDAYSAWTFNAFHAFFVFEIPYLILLMTLLTHWASEAFDEFRSVLIAEETDEERIRAKLLYSPGAKTLIASVVLATGFLIFLLLVLTQGLFFGGEIYDLLHAAETPLSIFALATLSVVRWFIYGGFGYHVYHQLSTISEIYIRWTRINIWDARPLYAFPRITALTAVGTIVSPYLWFALGGGLSETTFSIAMSTLFSVLALLIFIMPLRGVHEILEREKDRKLGEVARSLDALKEKLDIAVEQRDFSQVDGIHKAISSYQGLKASLEAVATWPWQPGLLRNVIGALAIPIVIWVIQEILDSMLQF
jgi:hypothetical protein